MQDHAHSQFRLSGPEPIPPAETLRDIILTRCPFNSLSLALRRSTLERFGGFNPRFDGAEDWELYIRLLQGGAKVISSGVCTVHYRVHAASMTHNPQAVLAKNVAVVRETIVPHLPRWRRRLHRQRVLGRLEGEAAIVLRQLNRPGGRRLMLRSLARFPFRLAGHYKIALHMVLFGDRSSRTQPVR